MSEKRLISQMFPFIPESPMLTTRVPNYNSQLIIVQWGLYRQVRDAKNNYLIT